MKLLKFKKISDIQKNVFLKFLQISVVTSSEWLKYTTTKEVEDFTKNSKLLNLRFISCGKLTKGTYKVWKSECASSNVVRLLFHNSMFECCSVKYESYQKDCFDTSYKSAWQVWLF